VVDLSIVIAAMLVVSRAVTPAFIAILTRAIVIVLLTHAFSSLAVVISTIEAATPRNDNACGRENQQCSHDTILGNSVQSIH
jgi:hypothetical protein